MIPPSERPIVIGYDRSAKARDAIESAGRLFPDRHVIVVCVWGLSLELRAVFGLAAPIIYDEAIARRQAQDTADEGCRLARAAGLDAEAETIHTRDGDPARALVDLSDQRRAGAVVVGGFEHGGLLGALHASFSDRVLDGSSRAVLVVPSTATHEAKRTDAGLPTLR